MSVSLPAADFGGGPPEVGGRRGQGRHARLGVAARQMDRDRQRSQAMPRLFAADDVPGFKPPGIDVAGSSPLSSSSRVNEKSSVTRMYLPVST